MVRKLRRCAAGPFMLATLAPTNTTARAHQEFTVVLGQRAPAVEHYAAQEFQKYVQAFCEFRPVIVSDRKPKLTDFTVLLGNLISMPPSWGALRGDRVGLRICAA
jgi:hypothetical protein